MQFYLEKGKKATIIVVDLQGRTMFRQAVTGRGLHKERISLLNKHQVRYSCNYTGLILLKGKRSI